MTAAALPVLQTHLPASLADLTALAAGIGIILLANFNDGILGIPWLTSHVSLPFADDARDLAPLRLDSGVARAA
jgi:hypothetical protein